jgi:GTP-binding protein
VFVDEVSLVVKAGDGGAGSASMRREPYTPRGGPDGGDGGRGGEVILKVDTSVLDLARYADRPRHRAKNGGPGASNNRRGADGEDLVLAVPDGTVVRDERGLVADLVGHGATVVVARGGRGGRGNASLASSRDRAPRVAERGEPGEERRLDLELRLVADVALVGAPNAGKSTLLARLTAARPKIADYPFTTVEPNLGVAGEDERFVVADVPGLVGDAHLGKGLGLRFLRHVSRCRVLTYVVDLSGDPAGVLAMLRTEIQAYDPNLMARRSLVVGTKADLLPDPLGPPPAGVDLAVSARTGQGMQALRSRLHELVVQTRAEERPPSSYVVLRPGRESFVVKREGGRYRVTGPRVERWVAEADLEDERQVAGLQRRLVRAGVERRLADAGARRGDEVVIGGTAFEFLPDEAPRTEEATRRSMARKRELAAAEDAAWGELDGLLESLTAEQLEEPGYYPEGWSAKDLMAHIGSWQAEAGLILQQIRNGTYRDSDVDVDAYNRQFYEANRDLPLSVVRAELHAARTRMLKEWGALPEVTRAAESWFRECGEIHYQEHLPRLREWATELR